MRCGVDDKHEINFDLPHQLLQEATNNTARIFPMLKIIFIFVIACLFSLSFPFCYNVRFLMPVKFVCSSRTKRVRIVEATDRECRTLLAFQNSARPKGRAVFLKKKNEKINLKKSNKRGDDSVNKECRARH